MPCLSRGFHLRVSTLSDFHIGLATVSGLREAPSVSVWVPPRVSLWFDGALLLFLGWLGSCRGTPAVRGWLCRWNLSAGCSGAARWSSVWAAEQDAVVRSGLQQHRPSIGFPSACCSPPGCCVGGDPCGRALGDSPTSRVCACE